MRIILQRVTRAKCTVDGRLFNEIGKGYVVLLGIQDSDSSYIADRMIEKIKNLRIFEDENGKINRNIAAVEGEILLIPQFTLYADCRKGNRPNFMDAANPQMANGLFNCMLEHFKLTYPKVKGGKFGADMQIELVNDGPFTISLDSDLLNFKKENEAYETERN